MAAMWVHLMVETKVAMKADWKAAKTVVMMVGWKVAPRVEKTVEKKVE